MSSKRQPLKEYNAESPPWKPGGDVQIYEVLEFTCPRCGSDRLKAVALRFESRSNQPYTSKILPYQPAPRGCFTIGFKCDACNLVMSGSSCLTTMLGVRRSKY